MQDEIKAIVKKRKHFEYSIHRRAPERIDYLRYIEYEITLDRLRRLRKRRLGLCLTSLTSIVNAYACFRHQEEERSER